MSIVANTAAPRAVEDAVPLVIMSKARKYFLLCIFCWAQFADVYSASAVVLGIPEIAADLGMGANESTWVINAYVITLASFMLAAGKASDLWSGKWVFVFGLAWVGIFSLGIGFAQDKITFFVLRAIKGMGAAAAIPSALHLIIHLFPRVDEQHIALSAFGASGEVANVAGFILGGALLVAQWRWVFWFLAPACIPLAITAALIIPSDKKLKQMHRDILEADAQLGDKRASLILADLDGLPHPSSFDYVGTLLLLAASVLMIFGLTDGSEGGGWARVRPIVTFVIGVLLFPAFFYYETKIDPTNALITPAIWRIRNVMPLTVVALAPYFWWYSTQFNFATIIESNWGISPIMTAVHFLPITVGGALVFILVIALPSWPSLKFRMLAGCALSMAGSLLLIFVEDQSNYWKLALPGFFLGSAGTAAVYITLQNAAMQSVPSHHSGVVGGVLNSVYQIGAATGLSITASLKAVYIPAGDGHEHGAVPWKAYQVTFGFMAVLSVVTALVIVFFYKSPTPEASSLAVNGQEAEEKTL